MKITEVLQIIQTKLNAPKNQYNSFGKYNYRNCEDILESLKPLLEPYKASVIISDEVVLKGDRFYVKSTATLYYDEESISATAEAREPDSRKGMDEAQVTGATSSYARKYALNGLFAIDDNKDPDNSAPPEKNGKPDVTKKVPNTKPEDKQASAEQIERIEELAQRAGIEISKLEKKYKVRVISALSETQAVQCINGLEKMIANG